MSGIYIPMKMPKCDIDCPIFTEDICPIESVLALSEMKEERHPSCPLIPVPAHGRMIDKDVMCNECRRIAEEYDGIYPDCTYCPAHIAPTIIPAEEGQ